MSRHLPFTRKQMIVLIVFGILLWFLAAMLLRILGPMGVYDGYARFILYALIIPGTWPFLLIGRKLAGLGDDQMALGVALATTAAMMCDGIALAWLPWIYGNTVALVAGAGGTILWGAAVGMVLGFLMNKTGAAT